MNQKTSTIQKTVFKTKDGYLHHEIGEGWDLEDDERNYSFTEDVLAAYSFPVYSPEHIPKYIGVTHEEDVRTKEQLCEVFKGEFVVVEIQTTISWKELPNT